MGKVNALDQLIEDFFPEDAPNELDRLIRKTFRAEPRREPERPPPMELPERFVEKEKARASIEAADALHTRENLRKFAGEYAPARRLAAELDNETLEDNWKFYGGTKEGRNSADWAAFNDERLIRMRKLRHLPAQSGLTAMYLTATVLDASHRYGVRAPGYWAEPRLRQVPEEVNPLDPADWVRWYTSHALGGKRRGEPGYQRRMPTYWEAVDMAKYGWSEDIREATDLPWWVAYGIGVPLEAITDPLTITGFGLGMKGMAKGAVQEMVQEAGETMLKTPLRVGVRVRHPKALLKPVGQAMRQPKAFIGIPGTEYLTKPFRGMGLVRGAFAPAKEPTEQIMRALWKTRGQKEAREAFYDLLKTAHPYRKALAEMDLVPEAYQRAGLASEFIPHVRKGEAWAKEALDEILKTPDELKAADLISDMYEELGKQKDALGLPYPKQEARLLREMEKVRVGAGKLGAKAERYIGEAKRLATQARGSAHVVAALEKRAGKKGSVLQQWFEEHATGAAKRAELLTDEAAFVGAIRAELKTQADVAKAADDAYDLYMRLDTAAKDLDAMSLQEVDQLAREAVLSEQAAIRGTKAKAAALGVEQKARAKVAKLGQTLKKRIGKRSEYLASKADEASGTAEKLSRQPGITKVARIEAIETAEDAYASYLGLKGVGAKVSDVPQSELDRALRRYLPKAEYGKVARNLGQLRELRRVEETAGRAFARAVEAPGAPALTGAAAREYGDLAKTVGDLQGVYRMRARVRRQYENLLDAMEGRVGRAEAVEKSVGFQRLMARAAQIDEELTKVPGYYPRPRKWGKVGKLAAGGKADVQALPKPLTLSGAAKERVVRTKLGRPKYMWETEKEFRRALIDPETLAASKSLRDDLMAAYDTKDLSVAVARAKKDIAGEGNIMAKLVELDSPVEAVNMAMRRMTSDVESLSMVESFGRLASDVKNAEFPIPATDFGPLVAKRWKGKFFPNELAKEYNEWAGRLRKAMGDKTMAGKMHDAALSYWKFSVTGPFPGFQVRNGLDDMWRAFANGPYNPVAVHLDGTKMAFPNASAKLGRKINAGKMGKLSAEEANLLCEAYDIGNGMLRAEIGDAPGAWLMRPFSIPEDIRRKGYFIEMIRQGNTPLEARRLTHRVFFDYGRMANWERSSMKRIIPFWNFRKNNLKFQIETLLTQPWWTATQMRFFRQAQVSEEGAPLVPDYLKGRTKIMFQEPGVTKVLYGAGLSVEDLATIVDAAGQPTRLWENVCKEAEFQVSPFLRLPIKAAAAGLRGKAGGNMVYAPDSAAKLPARVRGWLGITQERMPVGAGRIRKRWLMPSRWKTALREFRVWNEAMRLLRADRTPIYTDSQWDTALQALSGLTMVKYTPVDTETFMLRERVRTGYEGAERQGMLGPRGNLTPNGRRTPLGRQLTRDVERYSRMRHRQLRQQEREREKYE